MRYSQEQNRSRLTIGQDGNSLVMLIAIHLVVFVLLAFTKVIYYFGYGNEGLNFYQHQVLNYITLPANLSVLVKQPWTIFTHFFVHDSVWHIISNMLWLWAFGHILQNLAGTRKIVPVFIYGALAGAFVCLLSVNLIPALNEGIGSSRALGASAGVMAVAIAATAIAPGYRIFPMLNGGIPLWIVTMIFVILDLATIPYKNPGGHIAHLGGAAMGYAFVLLMHRGYDWSLWMNSFFDWTGNLFNPDKPQKTKNTRTTVFYKSNVPLHKKTTSVTQQKVDDILDKINQKGYYSLTDDEKDVLRRAAGKDEA